MRLAAAALALSCPLALVGAAAPASAAPGFVHLKVVVDHTTATDAGTLVYHVKLTNLGPDAATGVRLEARSRLCGDEVGYPWTCETVDTASHRKSKPIGPGETRVFPIEVRPGHFDVQVVHALVGVVEVDQTDTHSATGVCLDTGAVMDDCDYVVDDFRR